MRIVLLLALSTMHLGAAALPMGWASAVHAFARTPPLGRREECPFLQNVVGDEEDVLIMTRELGYFLYLIDSGHFSWARRPRLYWSSERLAIGEGMAANSHEHIVELICEAPFKPMKAFKKNPFVWPGGKEDPEVRVPTSTRAIPRRKPPPNPARAEEESVTWWRLRAGQRPAGL